MEDNNFLQIINHYKTTGHNIIEIKLSDGMRYTVIVNHFFFWRYSTFFVNLQQFRQDGKLVLQNDPNQFKCCYPAPDYSFEKTFDMIRRRNPTINIDEKELMKTLIEYTKKYNKEPLFDDMVETKIKNFNNFIIFDTIFTGVSLQPTETVLNLNATGQIKDLCINTNEIVSITPVFPELETLKIRSKNILEAIQESI